MVTPTQASTGVQTRRNTLFPVQIWVPDTSCPDFLDECLRQCQLVSQADMHDVAMHQLMDEALSDMPRWAD